MSSVAGFGVSNVWHSQASHFCSALASFSEDPAGRFQTPNELLQRDGEDNGRYLRTV